MEARLNVFVFMSLVVAASLHGSSAQTTHVVGDSLGWLVPPGGPTAYQTWAAGRNFVVGDTLVFNFTGGQHNVLEVSRAEFDSCNVSTTTSPPITTTPARITLNSSGEHHYMCTFPQHCSFGQKLAINVTAGGPTPAPAPAPSSPTTPSPRPPTQPPSSATPPSSPGPATPPSSTTTPPPSSATPPTSPGSPSETPSTPSTPTPGTAPPPPNNSAPSFAAAALPFTLLAVALAFLYN